MRGKTCGGFGSDAAVKLSRRDPDLKVAYAHDMESGNTDLPATKEFVKKAFASTPPVVPSSSVGSDNLIIAAKNNLPCSKHNLTHLFADSGDRITDSKEMAELLRRHWEPIFNSASPPAHIMSRYLGDYHKRIRHQIRTLSVTDFVEEISRRRTSSTGPDGIPFSVYRELVDIVAPIFHVFALHMARTHRANRSFNFTNIFFFPKDSTFRAARQRPISVGNTDNRIVANVIRRKITPAILDILASNQTAFNPNSSIEDNIRFFNERFYTALENNSFYGLFLHDFKNAYDLTSRDFLFTLLHRIGIPYFYIDLLEVLFQNTVAFPIMRDKHSIKIVMNNGLKQGCPLSPILFLLVLDPLITHLDRLAAESRAFCDVAAGLPSWERLQDHLEPVTHAIDQFCAASGAKTNADKLKLVCTKDIGKTLPFAIRGPWANITVVPEAVYNGVLIGKSVTVDDVYAKALTKFNDRIIGYMPCLSLFSTQQRVLICNVFLTTIFSFLNRVYLMSNLMLKRVRQLSTQWLVKANRFTYDHLTSPTVHAGIAQPVWDLQQTNVAAILRNSEIDVKEIKTPASSSMLMTHHFARAAKLYQTMTRTDPPEATAQSDLYSALQRLDKTSLCALAATYTRQLGCKTNGRILAKRVCRNTECLPVSLLSSLRYHAFEIIHNALPTRQRERWRGINTSCSFCDCDAESFRHLHVECKVVRDAANRIVRASHDRVLFTCLLSASDDAFCSMILNLLQVLNASLC